MINPRTWLSAFHVFSLCKQCLLNQVGVCHWPHQPTHFSILCKKNDRRRAMHNEISQCKSTELVRGASGASRASMRMGQTLIFISRDENKCSPCIYTQKNTKIVGARDYKPLCWLVGWLVHPLSLITKRLWLWALLNINFFYQTFF